MEEQQKGPALASVAKVTVAALTTHPEETVCRS